MLLQFYKLLTICIWWTAGWLFNTSEFVARIMPQFFLWNEFLLTINIKCSHRDFWSHFSFPKLIIFVVIENRLKQWNSLLFFFNISLEGNIVFCIVFYIYDYLYRCITETEIKLLPQTLPSLRKKKITFILYPLPHLHSAY